LAPYLALAAEGSYEAMVLACIDPRLQEPVEQKLTGNGRCRYVGITSTYSADYNAMEAIIRREKPDFVQVDYSMDNRAAEKRILPAAADAGAAVLTAMPFGRTSLFRAFEGKTLPDWAKDFDAATWGQFFLKFLLGNKQVTAVIPGTGNADHMIDNLGAARGRLPDAQQRERMAMLLAS
jgi:aryl-alcohol dehydrogenase-like predicted oxidoreductase